MTDMTDAHRQMARAMAPHFSGTPVSDLSHIPDEAVDRAHDISWGGEHANRHHIRMMLAAALPVLNTAKDSEAEALRAALDRVRAEHEHTYLDEHYRQTGRDQAMYARCDTCGNLPNGTLDCPTLAAASLRGEQ